MLDIMYHTHVMLFIIFNDHSIVYICSLDIYVNVDAGPPLWVLEL